MSINISDPLSLLPYQSGLADPVLIEAAANAANDLTAPQQAYKIGDPVPIVFCRRVSGNGGVMISPGATEGRYENDSTTNELTVSLHLVLSEGDLPTIPIKDVFVGPCRQGTWNQNHDRRSGTWIPGNFITVVTGKIPWTCPFYCGTSGRYEDMTTLSYVNSFPDGSQRWQQQVHVFVREGIKVTRIIDSTLGPSNNVIDLAIYLMNESGIIDSTLIDNTQMLAGANFCQTNGLFFNGVFKQSLNLDDWLAQTGNDFLLRLVETNGKVGYKPRLPVNADHTIKTTAIDWVFTFTEDHLLPDGFEIEYISLEDRQPVCLQMIWRQQPDADIGFPRTTEIRFSNEAAGGPFVQYDLSQFCTSETHAVKVGAYRLARRKYITHTLRLNVRPASYNSTLTLGDIVRVRLRRETATTALDYHDFLYEVERIEKTASGACVLDLTHFPIDSQGRSLVALEVNAATAVGTDIEIGRSDYSCDDNPSTDALGGSTALGSTGLDYSQLQTSIDFDPPDIDDLEIDLPEPSEQSWPEGGSSPTGGDFASPGGANPSDPLEEVDQADEIGIGDITGMTGVDGEPVVGDTLAVSESAVPCDGEVTWTRIDGVTGEVTVTSRQTQAVQGSYGLIVGTDYAGDQVRVEIRCKDPSTSSGYGPPRILGTTGPVTDIPSGDLTSTWVINVPSVTGYSFNSYNCDPHNPTPSTPYTITYTTSGSGPGPHFLVQQTAGSYTIGTATNINGCTVLSTNPADGFTLSKPSYDIVDVNNNVIGNFVGNHPTSWAGGAHPATPVIGFIYPVRQSYQQV